MKGSSYSSLVAAQETGFFGYPDDEPEDGYFDPEEETLRYQQRLQAEARREAAHEPNVPREYCCCVNCQERRLMEQALEDLPF